MCPPDVSTGGLSKRGEAGKNNTMRIEILVYEDNIKSAVRYCIMIGQKPTLKNVRSAIKMMLTKYGEQWVVEPTFDEIEDEVVDWGTAEVLAEKIAPQFYDKIF